MMGRLTSSGISQCRRECVVDVLLVDEKDKEIRLQQFSSSDEYDNFNKAETAVEDVGMCVESSIWGLNLHK